MKRPLILGGLVVGILLVGAVALDAAPRPPQQPKSRLPMARAGSSRASSPEATTTAPIVDSLVATPATLVANTPTTMTVTASITPPPISNSVNLLRIGATGTQPIFLGVMHDDGQNGDPVSGDGIYTLQVPFDESTAGQVQLQVSAAFQGRLMRIVSTIIQVEVWGVLEDPATGFQVLYPPGVYNTTPNGSATGTFSLSGSPVGVSMGDAGADPNLTLSGYTILITTSLYNPSTFDINQWLSAEYPYESISELTPITIGGHAAYEFQFTDGEGAGQPIVVVYRSNTIYQIEYDSTFTPNSQADQAGRLAFSLVLNNWTFVR